MPSDIIAQSRVMQGIIRRACLFAPSDFPVLIVGETGTGKTLLARWMHENSPRARMPFEARNCAALSETLALSDLFGHERGAFTGADRPRSGAFRSANGGTLFLDEVSRLPLTVQGSLLKAIDEGVIQPLGSDRTEMTNVRLIAATNQDLWALVDAGRFAEDLMQRLAVLILDMPPLRERPEDLIPLAMSFLRDRGHSPSSWRLTQAAVDALRRYPFPGNVRELRSILEEARLLVNAQRGPDLGPSRVIELDALNDVLERRPKRPTVPGTARSSFGDQQAGLRRETLAASLARNQGRVTNVARELGVSRQTVTKWVKELGLEELRRTGKERNIGVNFVDDPPER